MVLTLLLAACSALGSQDASAEGAIAGMVVNAADKKPVAHAEVVLRIAVGSQFASLAETISDAQGKFLFSHLPTGREYLPGANRDGVHYPGPRVRLAAPRDKAEVTLVVCDGVTQPSPLLLRRQEIDIQPEQGALRVSETLSIDNPTSTCYIGQSSSAETDPVTMQLSIPPDFARATFQEEFYGRRFSLANGKLVTGIPWPPGQRTLKLTYVLPNTANRRLWQRRLDLPCAQVGVTVHGKEPAEVACDLGPARVAPNGDITFQSQARVLPAGHIIRVELGHLPVPFMVYARWGALALLIGLGGAVGALAVKRQR